MILSTSGVPIPIGFSEYSRLRGGMSVAVQSQQSNSRGRRIVRHGASNGIANGLPLSRCPSMESPHFGARFLLVDSQILRSPGFLTT